MFFFIDKETFLIAKANGIRPAVSLRSTIGKYERRRFFIFEFLYYCSALRASADYNVFFGVAYPKRGTFDKKSLRYEGDFEQKMLVTSYFTESGLFLENVFHADLKECVILLFTCFSPSTRVSFFCVH